MTRDCDLPDTSTVLQRLWAVMSDPDCAEQETRQLVLLETLFAVTEDRIKLRDLQIVTNILGVIEKRAELESKYQPHFHKMLNLLKAPIRMEKSSDQLEYQSYIVELFTVLGYILLRNVNKTAQLDVLDIILRILLTKRVGDSDMVPISPCVKALGLSELAECLADFIAISEKEIYNMTIFTALQISLTSKLCCWTLLMKEVVESLLIRLTLVYNKDEADNMYQLLWALLNCTDRPEDWEKVPQPSRTALRSLRHVLREQALTHSHPGKDSDVLCNIAALALKIIHLFPEADFVQSGLTEDITLSATLSESVLEIHIIPFFKNKHDHLHFKKLMLACLAASPINPQSVEIFERYKLAECLVSMLRLDASQARLSWLSGSVLSLGMSLASERSLSVLNSDTAWFNIDQEQSIDIFRSAVPVVCALFDCLHERFIKAGLINTLTKFLKIFYLQDKNEIDDLFNMVIKLIFFICFNKKDPGQVRNALITAGATPILLGSCNIIINSNSSLTIRTQSILCHILHILSALMEEETELQIKHACKSFHIVRSLYHRIIQPLATDSVVDNRFTVAVSNFAWVALISKERNLLSFLDSGELYSHLDILERSDLPTQLVYLSMLVDIAEHHKSVPYLVSWRGQKGIKLLSVLCKIWREEEYRIKVPRNENGCITDIERPLMGEDQYKWSKENKTNYVSVCDVFGSCRPKIYALVQLLHRHDDVARICEEHYKLGYDVLPWEDQVTLQVIEAYMPLKLGEVWWEIFSKQEEVLPLDRYLAQTLADRYLNWSLSTQRAQYDVLKQRDAALVEEEQQYYLQVTFQAYFTFRQRIKTVMFQQSNELAERIL